MTNTENSIACTWREIIKGRLEGTFLQPDFEEALRYVLDTYPQQSEVKLTSAEEWVAMHSDDQFLSLEDMVLHIQQEAIVATRAAQPVNAELLEALRRIVDHGMPTLESPQSTWMEAFLSVERIAKQALANAASYTPKPDVNAELVKRAKILSDFVIEKASQEELSTHVAVSFDEDDAAHILNCAEALRKALANADAGELQNRNSLAL
jgi:hypothetical protein